MTIKTLVTPLFLMLPAVGSAEEIPEYVEDCAEWGQLAYEIAKLFESGTSMVSILKTTGAEPGSVEFFIINAAYTRQQFEDLDAGSFQYTWTNGCVAGAMDARKDN